MGELQRKLTAMVKEAEEISIANSAGRNHGKNTDSCRTNSY